VTFDEFAARVWDSRLSLADTLLPLMSAEWRRLEQAGADVPASLRPGAAARGQVATALARLQAWDRVADTASIETTWMVLAAERQVYAERSGGTSQWPWSEALATALDMLRTEWGTSEVPWGSINRHQRPLPGVQALDPARPHLAVGGGPGALGSAFTFNSAPFGVATPRIGTSGNSFVKVIEFAPSVRARSILNYGQSGDPASPHFFDQAALYAKRAFKPAWFSRADVEANAVRSYRVGG
jgi:acyl-homoserine-lactone acylase